MSKLEFDPQSKNCLVCGSDSLKKYHAQASDSTNQSTVNPQ